MLYYFAPILTRVWGPFRLLGSHLLLMGLGMVLGVGITWYFLPKCWNWLPRDRGRAHTPDPTAAAGKPTGAGFVLLLLLLPVLFLVLPFSARLWEIVGCLALAMLTGFLDDRSVKPWGEYTKGLLDLAVALLTSLALCQGESVTVWLPILKPGIVISPGLFVVGATALLWITTNATNCSDGVDALAGSLTLLSLLSLGAFLYVVIGHVQVADYLLIPHNPDGARWAILLFVVVGGLAGYLWYNAEPSKVLMGDAGSRFLGLLVGLAVLAAGNPFLILVVAPVVLANGGTGLGKVALLRIFKFLGFDTEPGAGGRAAARRAENGGRRQRPEPGVVVDMLHRVRFPLHDHCRKILGWSNTQVLVRFVLLQAILTPLLLVLLVKVR